VLLCYANKIVEFNLMKFRGIIFVPEKIAYVHWLAGDCWPKCDFPYVLVLLVYHFLGRFFMLLHESVSFIFNYPINQSKDII